MFLSPKLEAQLDCTVEVHNVELNDFISVINSCEGDVFLTTSDGDRLNLKSKLCQLIGITSIVSGAKLLEARLECTVKSDETKLFRFNMFGEKPTE